MKSRLFFVFIICLAAIITLSLKPNDIVNYNNSAEAVYPYANIQNSDGTIFIEVCDNDFDGIATFNLEEILQQLMDQNDTQPDEDAIYIAESYNGLIKIENVSTNPSIVDVCGTSRSLYEVAVDQNQDVFVSSQSGIYQVDLDNCNYQFIGNLPNNANIAMSFDTQNNLYVGARNNDKVYRADAGQFNNFYEWNDFGGGEPGGDFVMIGEYMYIAWAINGDNYLYQITMDADNQFLSYENLGQIDDNTYGMAAENGHLYGVTPNYLYEINLETMDTSRIIQNSSSTPWWGAAGLHEAISYTYSVHLTNQDALLGENPLGATFENTTPFNQTVYIRILEEFSGEVEIVNLELVVNIPPETIPTNLLGCITNGNFGEYDLSTAIPDMITSTNGISINYYTSESDAENQVNEIQTVENFQSTDSTQVIYVRFDNGNCASIDTITINNQGGALDLPSTLYFCEGESITIESPSGFDSYAWSGLQGDDVNTNDINANSITVTQPGSYDLEVTFGNNCSSNASVEVIQQTAPDFGNQVLSYCSDEVELEVSIEQILSDLSEIESGYHYTLFATVADAEDGINAISGNITVTDNYELIIQTRENPNDSCYKLSTLTIELNELPSINLEEDYLICEGESVTLTLPTTFGSYSWSGLEENDLENNDVNSNTITISQEGNYSVEVSNANCSSIKDFTVNFAPSAIIEDIIIEGNSATIITNDPNSTYSLNGIDWSSNPTFTDLDNDAYTAYVQGDNFCGIAQQNFTLFEINNFISPNNDGYNDYWVLKGIANYPDSQIEIYDRYGKLLVSETLENEFRWDGTYNGQKVVTGDYWYILRISDGREFKGHITVKNY